MALKSTIEWTNSTWNPVTGCTKISAGCDHCYAERLSERFRGVEGHPYESGFDLTLRPDRLDHPRRWRRPQLIFVNSMSDLFHKNVPTEYIESVFDTMELADWHIYQVLTKRSSLMRRFVRERYGDRTAPPHIWLGVSIENAEALTRLRHLKQTNASVRFVSFEPLLGPPGAVNLENIHWVIAGGESGPGARPVQPEWVRNLRDQCQAQDVAFFFKQWGGRTPKAGGNSLDGRQWQEYPELDRTHEIYSVNRTHSEGTMTKPSFFDESKKQSEVKSAIVAKYFDAWSMVMTSAQKKYRRNHDNKIAYIDLFAGPGRYSDGTISTPLLVLENAIQDNRLCQRLVTIFNDKDERNTNSLLSAIKELPGIETLKYPPKVFTQEVGEEIVNMFEEMQLIPILFFVDPWGYKGLSLRLVNSVLKDWGCDCIFFFNYTGINMGLNNDAVQEHMNALFGEERADYLRPKLDMLTPQMREVTIIEELCQAIRALGPQYVLPFRFKDNRGSRTSHHLIFVSKSIKGYEIMKEIMAKESSDTRQGVATFEYNPVDTQQPFLFELSRPLDDLGDMLLQEFAGQQLKMSDIYERHNVNRPYTKTNYKLVLLKLEEQGKIIASEHRKNTFADKVLVTFPDKEQNR